MRVMEDFSYLFNQPLPGYTCDITLVIDATESMASFISDVKENALNICAKFLHVMEERGRDVERFRVRVIAYRDYAFPDCPPMECSDFFTMPQQEAQLRAFLAGIEAKGGGDEPESALEALALAMRSDWTAESTRRRHIVVLFSDASAAELNDPRRTCHPDYPENMPKNMEELSAMWHGTGETLGGMPDYRWARLVAFAPNVFPWNELPIWNNVWNCFSKAGKDLQEFDYESAAMICVHGWG